MPIALIIDDHCLAPEFAAQTGITIPFRYAVILDKKTCSRIQAKAENKGETFCAGNLKVNGLPIIDHLDSEILSKYPTYPTISFEKNQ